MLLSKWCVDYKKKKSTLELVDDSVFLFFIITDAFILDDDELITLIRKNLIDILPNEVKSYSLHITKLILEPSSSDDLFHLRSMTVNYNAQNKKLEKALRRIKSESIEHLIRNAIYTIRQQSKNKRKLEQLLQDDALLENLLLHHTTQAGFNILIEFILTTYEDIPAFFNHHERLLSPEYRNAMTVPQRDVIVNLLMKDSKMKSLLRDEYSFLTTTYY